MSIDFKQSLKKTDKIQELFDYCAKIDSMTLDRIYESQYMARYGNIVKAKFWPHIEEDSGQKVNIFNLCSQNAYTNEFAILRSHIDIEKKFVFLWSNGYTIMRDIEGEIFQIENYSDYPPKIINTEVPLDVRKTFERVYHTIYTEYLPKLDPNKPSKKDLGAIIEAAETLIKEAEMKERRSKLKVIKAPVPPPNGEER